MSAQKLKLLSIILEEGIIEPDLELIGYIGKQLEKHNIDINTLDRYHTNGKTALMLAVEQSDPAMITTLCALGADVNATDTTNTTALSYAAVKGYSECVIALCRQPGIDPNITRTEPQYLGESPLMYACWQCTPEAVSILVHCGADVNAARQVGDRFTPLMYAINNRHGAAAARRIVDILLHTGADIYALDSDGDAVFNHPAWVTVEHAGPNTPLNTKTYRARGRALAAGKSRKNRLQRIANAIPPYGKNFVALQSTHISNPAFKQEFFSPTNLSRVRNLIGGRRTRRPVRKNRRHR